MRLAPAIVLVLVALAVPTTALAQPRITEVAWMGSDASTAAEWIELHNPDAQEIDLLEYVLIQGTTVRALAGTVGAGAFFVLERQNNADATPLAPPDAAELSFGTGLANGGQALCLCEVGATSCADASCDVANADGAWPAGDNDASPKRTMERRFPIVANGELDSSWQDGAPSSPGGPSTGGGEGEGEEGEGEEGEGEEGEGDEGEGEEGEGEPPPPNDPPTVTVTAPTGTVEAAVVEIVYSASDPDAGDAVAVDLFWSTSSSGNAGVRFAQGLPGGSDRTASFDTAAVPPGTVHVFAQARDTRGATAFGYAPGSVVVGGGAALPASFEILEPDGVNDVEEGQVIVTWTAEIPAGEGGAVSLFLDDDDEGEDGEPLIGGLSAAAGGPRVFTFELEGREPGERFVYGVLEHEGGRVVSYAPAAILVPGPGCGCRSGGTDGRPGLLAGASLAILLTAARRFLAPRRR